MIERPEVVLRRHGIRARHSWGQNFLRSPEVLREIVEASAARPGIRVVEIGAGLGTLTGALLATGAEVWAVERDRDLCQVLRQEFVDQTRLQLFEADAVRFDYGTAAEGGARPVIVGNLPYQITGPLLFGLLAFHTQTGPWIVMVQKEVADRLCAEPGSRRYGGATVLLSHQRVISRVCEAPRQCFLPPPKVDSAVIRFDPLPQPRGEVGDVEAFRVLVRTAFQRRRKVLTNCLGALASADEVRHWCALAGIDPKVRPERLSCEQFAALQRARESSAGTT